ncbi:MAG: hypothetical protein AAB484_03140 [Patescibacteria group bacterium]
MKLIKAELSSFQGRLPIYLSVENSEIQISMNLDDGNNGQMLYDHLKLALDFDGNVISLESATDGLDSRSITVKFNNISEMVKYLKYHGLNIALTKIIET